MNREIIININEANKSQKYQSKEELFQIEAFVRVTEILREHSHGQNSNNIVDCRFHDTIFINGDRGVGKTSFMLNIEKFYNQFINEIQNKNDDNIKNNKYVFCNPIDPTLLEHTEKFLSVVLARIVEEVNDNIGNRKIDENHLDSYYKILSKLSKSLESIKTLPNDFGIEEIASNKSSLKLEQYAHEFFKTVCNLFHNSHALVILIDDVDMAFDKGFDVLEVVRKYLASPYLIPIVAGDMKLYREIIETQFIEKINYVKDIQHLNIIHNNKKELIESDEYQNKKYLLDNLIEQYIHKIFPNEYQIYLKSFSSIISKNNVKIKFSEHLITDFNFLYNFELKHINLGINSKEHYLNVFSDNTRDFIQYLYTKKDIYIKHLENKEFILNIDLHKESLEKTAMFFKFSSYQELYTFVNNDSEAFSDNKYNIYNAFNSKEFYFSKNFLQIEDSTEKYSIKSKKLQSILDQNSVYKNFSNYIIHLFLFNDYYSSYQRRNYILSGKFIEMIIYSLSISDKITEIDSSLIKEINLLINKNIVNESSKSVFTDINEFQNLSAEIHSVLYEKSDKDALNKDLSSRFTGIDIVDIHKHNENFRRIANKIPFGSEFLINERLKDENFEDDDSNEINESSNMYELDEISRAIIIWRSTFLDKIELNSISLFKILLKFFKNLDKLKKLELNELKENQPIVYFKRMVLILINSVAYFESDKENLANINIAINKEFNINNILSKTPASLLNIKPMFEKENTLTRALFFHPIISFILFYNDSKLNNLEFVNQKEKNEQNIININFNDIKTTQAKIDLLSHILDNMSSEEIKKISSENKNFKDPFLTKNTLRQSANQGSRFLLLQQRLKKILDDKE